MIKKLNILMLAHDLADAAIAKRIRMFKDGGADVAVAGFRRTPLPVQTVGDCPVTDLGKTLNGTFIQRIWAVTRNVLGISRHDALFAAADIIVARNLEMLAIAVAGARRQKQPPVVIYEILDIHRLLLDKLLPGKILRWLERRLLAHAQAVFTSSPSYISEYFGNLNPTALPIHLIENKLLHPPAARPELIPLPQQPWVIGWFGIIRCKKSLHILAELVRKNAGRIEVIIGGRPALDQIPEFHEIITTTPGLSFTGPYKNPDDLPALYEPVHFNWTIDMYEEGCNSSWLLPNRLYEGSFYHAVPLALETVETGRYLKNLGIGVLLQDFLAISLGEFFSGLTVEHYQSLSEAVKNIPAAQWVYTAEDCKNLVQYMGGLLPVAEVNA